eukprot:6241308-Pyramimonas_sp.AAC.1
MIWTIHLSFDNPTGRSRDRLQEGLDVLRARFTLTCAFFHRTEKLSIAGGMIRKATIGNVRAVRILTAITSLDMHGYLANASLPNLGNCPTIEDRHRRPLPNQKHHHPRHKPHHR